MTGKDLAQKKCEPCRGGIPPMEEKEAREYLKDAPGWALADDAKRISKEFKFETFPGAIDFVNRVAEVAEDQGHHPDLHIHYNKVEAELWTHKIDGLHENDFIMAAKLDELAGD
ncbi:MAG: 4a-hydroxytetrahydrobiopterin dehydratase [Gemmatimonadetes bacterium]|uniref:Putative pterin-4-alpha-carbinolamine dehydratase n=1 Tax=Candidatus Kutchimonas denitrificans TaxID=3056748 RepID=A0AAE4Z775_9BACT|nr:4a-hydroxytetrahydrobiopterin dehydratase [Gemmatimonadota bacterium]NIR73732.1 4a-hydroxytetrahydrobiopterin dehydratase [Candidatus Kutchimonas denitrificans]NIS02472.1 4a-hydroxytetrahydrobiopterin dehydratase [Gemmatimonadota bacterium]NIT67462.1 4a-hydroxytetrahydrobiopterin dehydratase [Gemmatimonadota bacterium]NIU51594.1 4a-hydroxytetrahydrobiopterin dehydratase [Gemmatimonadota bacterium]